MNNSFKHHVATCACCGQEHKDLEFKRLSYDEFTFWASCPVTGEPLRIYKYDMANARFEGMLAEETARRRADPHAIHSMPFPVEKPAPVKADGIKLPPSMIMDLIEWRAAYKEWQRAKNQDIPLSLAAFTEMQRCASNVVHALAAFLPPDKDCIPVGWPEGMNKDLVRVFDGGPTLEQLRRSAWQSSSVKAGAGDLNATHIGKSREQLNKEGFWFQGFSAPPKTSVLWDIQRNTAYFLPPEFFKQ